MYKLIAYKYILTVVFHLHEHTTAVSVVVEKQKAAYQLYSTL